MADALGRYLLRRQAAGRDGVVAELCGGGSFRVKQAVRRSGRRRRLQERIERRLLRSLPAADSRGADQIQEIVLNGQVASVAVDGIAKGLAYGYGALLLQLAACVAKELGVRSAEADHPQDLVRASRFLRAS